MEVPCLWEHVASTNDRLPRVTMPKCRFGLPSVRAVLTLYIPCACQRTPVLTMTPGQGALVKEQDRRRKATGSRWRRGVQKNKSYAESQTLQGNDGLPTEWGGGFKSWILEARRVQIHPSPLGICRLVIRFRHSLSYSHHSQRKYVRHSILHTDMWEGVFLGGQGRACSGKQEDWILGLGPCSAPGPFF